MRWLRAAWRWYLDRYHLVSLYAPVSAGALRLTQRLYWHRSYTEAPHAEQ